VEEQNKILTIKEKVIKLINNYESLSKTNKKLEEDNEKLKELIIEKNKNILDLEDSNLKLKLKLREDLETEESKKMKQKVSGLVRVIDKCIASLE